jgi:hypothetical protein
MQEWDNFGRIAFGETFLARGPRPTGWKRTHSGVTAPGITTSH